MAGKDAKKQRRKLFTDLRRVLKHVNRDGSSGQIAAVLEPWVLDIQEESSCLPEKLAIPLKGNYPMKGEHPKRHLSFEGLERKDRIVAEALRNCKDSDGHQLLDVFLCIVTLHRSGRAAPTYGAHTYSPPPSWVPESCYDPPSEDEDEDEASGEDYGHEIGEIDEQRLEGTMFRIDWNNKQVNDTWSIEKEEIVVEGGKNWISGFDIENPNYSNYDSDDSYLSQWCHRAMLVVWPCEQEEEEARREEGVGEDQEEEEGEEGEKEDNEDYNNDNGDSNSRGCVHDPGASCEPEKKKRRC